MTPKRLIAVALVGLVLAHVEILAGESDDSVGRFPIWFVSWQHIGHIKALCPIVAELRRRGWDARVVVHDEMAEKVPKGLPVESAGSLPWNWEQELHFRHSMWDPEPRTTSPENQREIDERKAELSERYFVGSQRSLAEGLNATLQERPREDWPGLLVIDVSSVGAMDLAEQLHLPFAVVSAWPVGPTLQSIGEESALSHSWLPSELFAFTQAAHQQSFFDRVKRFLFTGMLPRLMEFQGFHEPRRIMRHDMGLPSELQLLEVPKLQPRDEWPLVIVLSHWGLDRARPLPSNVLLTGPVENYTALVEARSKLPAEVLSWIQHQPGSHLVYVSFGTNVKPRRRMLRELIKGMGRSHSVRFLWDASADEVEQQISATSEVVLSEQDSGHDLVHSEELSLPQNILFSPGVDQLAVLASGKVDAFVSHCGLNSVHEAMHFGVPIVGLPFLGDQLITSYLVEESGSGVRLSVPRLSAYFFEESIRKITNDPQYRTHAERVGQLGRVTGGVDAAANALEAISRYGVAHLQAIRDTHPGSDRLWDVYLALFILLMVVLGFLGLCIASFSQPEATSTSYRKEKRG